MVGQRLALLRRLARDGLEGEHDIAEQDRRAGRRRSSGSVSAKDSTLVGASLPR